MCPSTDYPNRTHVPHVDRSVDATYYAESHDGLAFRRPALGQVPWPLRGAPRDNNMAIDAGGADPNRGVYLDVHEPDAAHRYKAFGSFGSFNGGGIGGSRLGIVTSADGRAWGGYTAVDAMAVNGDTANNLLFDPDLGLYLAFTRKDVRAGDRQFGIRREYRSTAPHWSGPWSPAVEVARGEAGYELYSLLPFREPSWVPGEYFGVASFYADALPSQRVYCELMHSSDHGASWVRVAPHRPFIPPGAGDAFDNTTCYSARPTVDPADAAKTRIYYSGGNGPHSGARSDFIALATVPSNAFAGLAVGSGGVVVTERIGTGRRLHLTAELSAAASLRVALLDAAGGEVAVGKLAAQPAGGIARFEVPPAPELLGWDAAPAGRIEVRVRGGGVVLYALAFES